MVVNWLLYDDYFYPPYFTAGTNNRFGVPNPCINTPKCDYAK